MGNTLNSVEPLGEPFQSVDEQVFFIPRTGSNEVPNPYFKIIFALEGNSFHEVDGEDRVRFDPGDVLIIPRVCRHRYLPVGRGPQRIHALRLILSIPPFPADHRRTAVRGDVEKDFASFLRHHLQEVRHLPEGQNAALRPLLADLRREAEERRPGYRFRVTALCTDLTIQLVRQLTTLAETPADPLERPSRAYLVLQTKEYLLKNLALDLRLDQIAWHLGVSPEHLARTFKAATGQTVFTHLQQLRVERAKTYLLGSDRSIAAIAEQTGYSSVALFSRTFKRLVGASPLAYRQERWNRAVENGYRPPVGD